MEATVLAGEQRLRPIIMTSLAFAAGCLPLALAMGAGANARHSIGTGIIGGMIGETTLAMLYVPLLFYLFDRFAEGKRRAGRQRTPPRRPRRGGRRRAAPRRRRRQAPRAAGGRLRCVRRRRSPRSPRRCCAGCTMGPDYVRPNVDAPAAFRFEPEAVADTANTAWWKQFDDPVLDQLIDAALANNLNVKIAAANVEQALAVITQTRSALFPQVGYAATGERARTPETGADAAIPNSSRTRRRPTRRCSPRAGRSTSGAASGACPRRRGPTCSRPTRPVAA